MKYVCCWSGGKDSTASIILSHLHGEPIDLILFCEVMFDSEISGEIPEHMEFIRQRCIPQFRDWGYEVQILHSDKTYMDVFQFEITRGERKGLMRGFPLAGMCAINRDCKIRPIKQFLKKYDEDSLVQYVGIAADEPMRLRRLEGTNQVSLLDKYGYTEQMAHSLCQDYGLISPIYNYSSRGGCFFCPNARETELCRLRECHPKLWNRLLELEKVPNTVGKIFDMRSKRSLLDLEKKFKWQM